MSTQFLSKDSFGIISNLSKYENKDRIKVTYSEMYIPLSWKTLIHDIHISQNLASLTSVYTIIFDVYPKQNVTNIQWRLIDRHLWQLYFLIPG